MRLPFAALSAVQRGHLSPLRKAVQDRPGGVPVRPNRLSHDKTRDGGRGLLQEVEDGRCEAYTIVSEAPPVMGLLNVLRLSTCAKVRRVYTRRVVTSVEHHLAVERDDTRKDECEPVSPDFLPG